MHYQLTVGDRVESAVERGEYGVITSVSELGYGVKWDDGYEGPPYYHEEELIFIRCL